MVRAIYREKKSVSHTYLPISFIGNSRNLYFFSSHFALLQRFSTLTHKMNNRVDLVVLSHAMMWINTKLSLQNLSQRCSTRCASHRLQKSRFLEKRLNFLLYVSCFRKTFKNLKWEKQICWLALNKKKLKNFHEYP